MTEADDTDEGGPGLPIDRIFSAIRRRLRLIIAFVLSATALTVAVALSMPDVYQASAIVQIDPRQKSISNMSAVITQLNGDAATLESQVEVIRSRALALKVINLLDLRNDPELSKPMGLMAVVQNWGLLPSNEPPPEFRYPKRHLDGHRDLTDIAKPGNSRPIRDWMVLAFLQRLNVQRVRNTLLISVSFRATDPQKAAKIANTIAEVYVAEQLDAKKRLTGFATKSLEKKLEEMRKSVMEAERKVAEFKADNGIFDSEGQILSEKQMARLMEQTILARNETSQARARYEQARRIMKNGGSLKTLSNILQSNTVRLMREKLAESSRKRAELATKYGPRHPKMVKVEAEVKDARREVDQAIERLIAGLENDYQEARTREAELKANLAEQKNAETHSKDKSVKLKALEREAKTSKLIFEALLARYKQTAETQDLQLPDVHVVDVADVPLLPSSPKRKQLVAIGVIGGVGASLLLVLALEFATTGIGRPEDVEAVLELPHLSSLPAIGESQETDPLHHARLTIAEPTHDFVEAIRHARRELDLSADKTSGRIILITAAVPGEGTSLIASNLAHHYALTGERVLLVDADIRRANLSRELAPERRLGLANVLVDAANPESAILHDTITNLCFLPATPSGPAPQFNPESLASPVFIDTMNRLSRFFDVIIMDTPPILPVIDTQFLSDTADQIVFVMSWRKTPRALARKALKALGPNRERVAGAMVNRVDPEIITEELGMARGMPIPA